MLILSDTPGSTVVLPNSLSTNLARVNSMEVLPRPMALNRISANRTFPFSPLILPILVCANVMVPSSTIGGTVNPPQSLDASRKVKAFGS